MKKGNLLLFLLIFITSQTQATTEVHALQNIRVQVSNYLDQTLSSTNDNISYELGQLDSRLRLNKCQSPLDISPAANQTLKGQTTLLIVCNNTKKWQIYLPIRISEKRKVWVAARTITRGELISQSDIKELLVDIHLVRHLNDADPKQFIGASAKRTIYADQALNSSNICLVCKGSRVKIVSNSDTFKISMSGIAMSDGNHGEFINVRNSSSNRIVQGKVVNSQMVSVGI